MNTPVISGVADDSLSPTTAALKTIDYPHHEIHSGSHYVFTHVTTAAGGGGTYTYRLVTPNTTTWAHLTGLLICDQPHTVVFREGTTFSGNGTAGAEINRNRNSANTATLQTFYGATVDSAGTVLYTIRQGSRGQVTVSRNDEEFILKQNTAYDLTVTNHTVGTDANVTMVFDWYEHTDK